MTTDTRAAVYTAVSANLEPDEWTWWMPMCVKES